MKKITIAALVMFVVSTLAYCVMQERIISVSGQGEVNVDPNVAYIRFGVGVVEDTAASAQSKNAEKMEKLVKALVDAGIENENIETYNFSLSPLMRYPEDKKPEITGYKCDNEVRVTVDNLDATGRIIDTAISAGANEVNDLQFSVKDEPKYKNMAFSSAIEDARGKARAIEEAARVQIKRIFSIEEGSADVAPYEVSRANLVMASGGAQTPIMTGKIKITANVLVNFEY